MSRRTQIAVVFLLCVAGLGLIAVAVGDSAPEEPSYSTFGTITRVKDGDTVVVTITKQISVRLIGAWSPEAKADPRLPSSERAAAKAKGLAAKKHLEELCLGKEVIVQIPLDPDGDVLKATSLGRVLGNVWLKASPETSLSERQVSAGHATKTKPEELNR